VCEGWPPRQAARKREAYSGIITGNTVEGRCAIAPYAPGKVLRLVSTLDGLIENTSPNGPCS
jgi:hypothetical protein